MTARALRTVAVDWQVAVQPGADPAKVLGPGRRGSGRLGGRAGPVRCVDRIRGDRRRHHPEHRSRCRARPARRLPRPLPGPDPHPERRDTGVLIAQQTAANLRVQPGDSIAHRADRTAGGQRSGRPVWSTSRRPTPCSRRSAHPRSLNRPLHPTTCCCYPPPRSPPCYGRSDGPVATSQIHVARRAPPQTTRRAPTSPTCEPRHHLEAHLAGGGVVGNNVGAALDAARSDAAYAQMLFLFLGLPGAVLAALLTAAMVGTGATRRRTEQALLRTRGLDPRRIASLAAVEALLVGVAGGCSG